MFSAHQGIIPPSNCSFWISCLFGLVFVFRLYGAHSSKREGQQKGSLLGKSQKVKLSHPGMRSGRRPVLTSQSETKASLSAPFGARGLPISHFLVFPLLYSPCQPDFSGRSNPSSTKPKSVLQNENRTWHSFTSNSSVPFHYLQNWIQAVSIKTPPRHHLPRVYFHHPFLHHYHHS